MPLFLCDRCSVIENTALSGYWCRSLRDGGTGEALCSECDKGTWHGKFPREIMTQERIDATTDWSSFVYCDRLKSALERFDQERKLQAAAKAEERRIAALPKYSTKITMMPNRTRSERKAKQRAKRAANAIQ